MRARLVLPLAVIVALAGVGGWAFLRDAPAPRAEHPGAAVEIARTVTVSATMPLPSAHVRNLSAMLKEGAMPEAPMLAEVLTDTECAPDRHMISRCRNEIRLADGRTIVLRHPHDMTKIPCLAPGERVHVVPSAA